MMRKLDNINTTYDSDNFHEYNSSKKLVDVILKTLIFQLT